MTGFNHGLTGAVIALSIKQPALAIPTSFVSHYLADFIPHYGFKPKEVFSPKFNLYLKSDFVFSVLMMVCVAALFPSQTVLIWTCMIAAAAPDLVWWFYRKSIKNWPRDLDRFTVLHYKINDLAHTDHFYFDIFWFTLMWATIIFIKFK